MFFRYKNGFSTLFIVNEKRD